MRLLHAALDEARDTECPVHSAARAQPSPAAPLLSAATLRVDAERARTCVLRLGRIIALPDALADDALALIRAAIAQDDPALADLAARLGAAVPAVAVVAQFAAMPLLMSCWRELASGIPSSFRHGWCPLCGAWPTLAEVRGIERRRRLRCGRCTAEWSRSVLHCPFCDETDHQRLGSLVAEGMEQRERADTCERCRGYLKSVATLEALSPETLWLRDLATVPLDLAARDHGYARPARAAFALDLRVVA